MGFKTLLVGSRVRIEAIGPGFRHNLYQVVIADRVLGKHHEVTTGVVLRCTLIERLFSHIHLAAENRLEAFSFSSFYFRLNLLNFSKILRVGCVKTVNLFFQ